MVVLVAVAAIGLAACYSPSLRDCTVTCSAATDCARGQVCGNDGLCAAPDVADHCTDVIADAGIDARPPVDAVARVNLHVHIDGEGDVELGAMSCKSGAPQNGNCDFSVVANVSLTLDAVDLTDHVFEKWTAGPCIGQVVRTCAFAPIAATDVGAKWH